MKLEPPTHEDVANNRARFTVEPTGFELITETLQQIKERVKKPLAHLDLEEFDFEEFCKVEVTGRMPKNDS